MENMSMMSMTGYDSWAMYGYKHECACGKPWYDSDGRPCHEHCAGCNKVVEVEELDENGRCDDCTLYDCKGGCGDTLVKKDLDKQGLCSFCAEEVAKVKAASIEELPTLIGDFKSSVAQDILNKRLQGIPITED